ncbi:MAG: lanthionine synthetase LanC family protein [Bacteroidota bacterium]
MQLPDYSKAIEILHVRISKLKTDNPTLFSGVGGKVLFYAYLARNVGEGRDNSVLNDSIQHILDNLSQATHDPGLADGYTGIAWLLQHLINESFHDEITQQMVSGFDKLVINSLPFYQKNHNYDPLYGAIGAGLYFIERGTMISELKSVIEILAQLAVTDNGGISWLDRFTDSDAAPQRNLGLSHGVTGIILFLINSHRFVRQKFPESRLLLEQLSQMIADAVNWLIDQEKPCGYSTFPNNAENTEESRLGWSYGDLGIAYCILLAAKEFNNKIWSQKGLAIGLHTLKRGIPDSHMYLDHHQIPDAGICNGAAGIALLYHSLFKLTTNQKFVERSAYWHGITIQSIIAAYEIYGDEDAPVANVHWWNDISLIKGLSGIGLSLSSGNLVEAGWKKALLLA